MGGRERRKRGRFGVRQPGKGERKAESTHANELPRSAVVNSNMILPAMALCDGEVSTVGGAEGIAWCAKAGGAGVSRWSTAQALKPEQTSS